MSNRITILVSHPPMGAPRMTRADKWNQRDCVMRYRAFKDAIRAVAEHPRKIDPNKVASLSWVAYFEPPPSWSRKKRLAHLGELHRQKPDRDNIDKAVLDAMFSEDSAIASGTIEKRWGEWSRIEIIVVMVDGS